MIGRDSRHLEGRELDKLAEIANLRGLDLMLVEQGDEAHTVRSIEDGLRAWPVRNTRKK